MRTTSLLVPNLSHIGARIERVGCFAGMLVFTVLLLLTQGNSEIVSVQLEGFSVESQSAPKRPQVGAVEYGPGFRLDTVTCGLSYRRENRLAQAFPCVLSLW